MQADTPDPDAEASIRTPADVLERLRALLEEIRPANRHDQAIVLIEACILEGIDTRPQIVRVGRELGFDYRHVAMTLNAQEGRHPDRHRWCRDAEGRYRLSQ